MPHEVREKPNMLFLKPNVNMSVVQNTADGVINRCLVNEYWNQQYGGEQTLLQLFMWIRICLTYSNVTSLIPDIIFIFSFFSHIPPSHSPTIWLEVY